MARSRAFGSQSAVHAHLARPKGGGLEGEVADLRSDVERAFQAVEGEHDGVGTVALLTSSVVDAALPDAKCIWVASVCDWFMLHKASVVTPDAITAVTTKSGAGRWLRRGQAAPKWLRQATWYIDPVSGNDENTGMDLAHAIKTDAERQRRWGLIVNLKIAITVTIASSLPSSDPINGEIRLLAGGKFVLIGTTITTRTSTFTAVTAINRASAQALHVTDGTFDWTSSVGSQITITSGARAGMKTFIAKAVSAGVARLGPGLIPPTLEWDLAVAVTPAAADAYQVRTLPDVYLGDVRVINANDVGVGSTANTLLVQDLRLRGDSGIKGLWETRGVAGNFNGCAFDSISIVGDGNCSQTSCRWVNARINGGFIAGGVVVNDGLAAAGANTTYIDFDCLGQGGNVVNVFYGALVQIANACAFDGSGGVLVGVLARLVLQHVGAASGASLWGTTASGRGIKVGSRGDFVFSVAAAITINSGLGLGREAMIGATDKLISQLPFTDTTKQAFAVNT